MTTHEHANLKPDRQVIVSRNAGGWEVREEHNSRVVRRTNYNDWHRVERALHLFEYDLEKTRAS